MKTEYIRNLSVSHMVVEQLGEQEEWEKEMIAHSRIEGVLFAQNTEENGERKLWYNITGKQGLDVVLEKEELGFELLCAVFRGLYEVMRALEEYLLRTDDVMLRPECIFVEHITGKICFCYYPGNRDKMPQALKSLTEYLMKKLNHGDQKAVNLAYSLYEKAVKESFCLSDLGELIRIPYDREEIPEREELSGTEELRAERSQEKQPIPDMKDNRWKRVRDFLLKLYTSMIKKDSYMKKKRCLCSGRDDGMETFVFEPDEEEKTGTPRPTVLLADVAGQPDGVLCYEGRGTCSDLTVTGNSYTIGSGMSCDGHVPSATVSRIHARISRIDDIYFIEDLNSANGTYVGSELLNYKVKMSLRKNEIIVFADEKFRFI